MAESEPIRFEIKSFDPLTVVLPKENQVSGKVRIVLPDIHVQLYDLSMGIRELKGAHIGSDAPLHGMLLEFSEPVSASEVVKLIIEGREQFETVWKTYQAEYDKKGALL